MSFGLDNLRRILIVEDSEILHKMYDLMFAQMARHGLEIVHTRNGREGLDALCENPSFDLILLDINMPVLNGVEFMEQVRDQPAFQNIPIIVISTRGKEEDTLRCLKLGARAYQTKPFQPTDLFALIGRLFQSNESNEPLARKANGR